MRRLRPLFLIPLFVFAAACGRLDRYDGTYDQVFIYCGLGFNNLTEDLRRNLETVRKEKLPWKESDRAVLAFCHNARSSGDFASESAPLLLRLYSGNGGMPYVDTLKVYDDMAVSATEESLRRALDDIRRMFPARHYGMLFSSHGTGWIPGGYTSGNEASSYRSLSSPAPSPWPATKAIGNQFHPGRDSVTWLELDEFAAAIPMKLDYLILDACLMGSVEVAFALKDLCDYLVFSPAEILTDGMNYKTLTANLLLSPKPDLPAFCQDFFDYYDRREGSLRSATVTLVDCSRLDALADAFAPIVAAHSGSVTGALRTTQRYFYTSTTLRFYYDLRDFALQIGASDAELARLDAALADCVLYHAETPTFFDLELERCCGLSLYIPDPLRPRLNRSYRGLAWNERVSLVP